MRPVAWKRLSDDEKLLRSFLTAEKHNGWAFTLRLSRQVRSSLGLFSCNPTRLMSHRLNRELKKAFGRQVPYAFVFEEDLYTDLHVHGVIIPNSPADRKKLIKALQKAGGVFSGHAASRQVKLKGLGAAGGYERDAGGYLDYANLRKTRRWLGLNDITHISQELRRMAEADHRLLRLNIG